MFAFIRKLFGKSADESHPMDCCFCGKTIGSVDEAVEDGWIPSYWDSDNQCEIDDPVCPDCTAEKLVYDAQNSDYATKP